MGKKNKDPQPQRKKADELLETLGDFTSKENWDKFFTIRGTDDSFEWYAEWPELKDTLLSYLSDIFPVQSSSSSSTESSSPSQLQVLIPGCGNSRLSEHLYDAGFASITNIDFSKVVISDMLRRNIRQRPHMRWRVMDMTAMQFKNETFDAVVDKGGLDALMEPELGPKLGDRYLSEVKRVLRPGGKYVCLSLAESHVLGLLFSKSRFGWKIYVSGLPLKSKSKASLQTFIIVLVKDTSTMVHEIDLSFSGSSLDSNSMQVCGLRDAVESENKNRREYASGFDLSYSLEDLHLGVKGDLSKKLEGRRILLTLGGEGTSHFSYHAVLLDARNLSCPCVYQCGVFIVPQIRCREWLFASEEGQWEVVESSKAARLIMVFLDASHSKVSMDDIQKDLSPMIKQLAPGKDINGAQIPFMMASEGIKQRNILHQVTSSITGPIVVEDVVYENVHIDVSHITPSRDLLFRRLIFGRASNLVQSEALLIGVPSSILGNETEKKIQSPSKSKRDSSKKLEVYHGYLASSYHMGIISGFILISSYIESLASKGKLVKATVIGLGAGLLPMFLHGCMPFLQIEVVELDPVIVHIARDYFNFNEDTRMKVHVGDGIKYIKEIGASLPLDVFEKNDEILSTAVSPSVESHTSFSEDSADSKVDIIIIDVDCPDSSSGLTCPAPDFVEESFLEIVKDKLSEQGLFVVNVAARSPAIKEKLVRKIKNVFKHLFVLKMEEDVNEVHFALNSASCVEDSCDPEVALKLEKLLKFRHPETGKSILDDVKRITRVQ